ncbi:DUF4174 domain-containing protein [Jannaschia seohaensis]|uniref:Uncharacterized protein DUF4174 n=1 Tax=Jannaschia seohaensis TaxID=475081 RepID=A0A2Y9AUR9_9RHOB|nr:DUF4174 domain-containing protein [Jannaschia seohaensis]PWJ16925.1 uncharacterized protein DUF4174 [Jannaschia seohaensis]SSA48134.1 protein of unknown function [Jannaschia seohaensis]
MTDMLKATALLATLSLTALPALAQDTDSLEAAWLADPTRVFNAQEVDLDALQWIARPLVVFANSPRDPAFIQQMEEIAGEFDQLVERDVIVIVDTDPAGDSALRERLRPRGFMLTLIGKDGQVKLRKPLPWSVREISRSIDKMPMRQREQAEGRDGRIDG